MELVTVKTFNTELDARIFMVRLEGEGIECFLFDDNIVGVNPLFNIAVGGVKLKVKQTDVALVHEIIEDIQSSPYTDENGETICCPHCGSTDVMNNFASLSNFKNILALFTTFVFSLFPIYRNTVFRCNQCATEFKTKVR